MLSNAPVGPNIPTKNLEQARKYYSEVLGLEEAPAEEHGAALFKCGKGTMLMIYEKQNYTPEHTLATWIVDDLDAEMAELRGRGVKFEDFDVPGARTTNQVGTSKTARMAWFKDPDGNTLALLARVPS